MEKRKLVILTGPTAVGKTKLSIELAKKYNAIIINCDAMQVYKDLNIGTAKVTEEEKEDIKHYLFDIKDVTEENSEYNSIKVVCRYNSKTITKKCPHCNGEGIQKEDEVITLNIPAGVMEGMQLSMSGKGNAARHGGVPGDSPGPYPHRLPKG